MKFQDVISNMNTHKHTDIRTSRNQYVPHFFKVGGINISSFKSSENIQKKEGGPDRSVSDNQSFQ